MVFIYVKCIFFFGLKRYINAYNGIVGMNITSDSKYIFLDKDVIGDITIGDFVIFRDEYLYGINKAYFIGKYQL